MAKLAANISHLWTELPFSDRFAAAKGAGFSGVEILYPYDIPARTIRQMLDDNALKLALYNMPPPENAMRGFAADPSAKNAFRRDMAQVMEIAEIIEPDVIHIMAGYTDAPEARTVFVKNLSWAARKYPHQRFSVEPLNLQSQPGYWLADYDLARDVISEVAHDNLGLQYDTFHADMIHSDALVTLQQHIDIISHVQLGNPPNRTEPARGRVDFTGIRDTLRRLGYDGWISAEYTPSTFKTEDSLDWLPGWCD